MHFVMPENFVVVDPWCGDSLCVAILNATGGSLTARLKNIADAVQTPDTFKRAILLRNVGLPQVTQNGQRYLSDFRKAKGRYLELDEVELATIHAIYDTVVDIEECNRQQDPATLTLKDLVAFIARLGLHKTSKVLQVACQQAYFIESRFWWKPPTCVVSGPESVHGQPEMELDGASSAVS